MTVISMFPDGETFLLSVPGLDVVQATYYKGSWGLVATDVEAGTSRASTQAWTSLAEATRALRDGTVKWREA